MDEINRRLSDLSSRLSSVSRVRLVVGLVVVLVLTWLVSPVFHGLAMALYVNWPFLLVVVVSVVLGTYLWRGDKDPAKIVAVVATIAALAYPSYGFASTGPEIPGFDRGRRDQGDARHNGDKVSPLRCGRSFRAEHPR